MEVKGRCAPRLESGVQGWESGVPGLSFHSLAWSFGVLVFRFWLIYSKNAENGMSFEIHLATITTGSLSFGLKNP